MEKRFEQWPVLIKKRCLQIVLLQEVCVARAPLGIRNFSIAHPLSETSTCLDWYRQPSRARSSLESISVSPVILGELDVIVDYKFVDVANDVEVPLPWYVIGLKNRDASAQLINASFGVRRQGTSTAPAAATQGPCGFAQNQRPTPLLRRSAVSRFARASLKSGLTAKACSRLRMTRSNSPIGYKAQARLFKY